MSKTLRTARAKSGSALRPLGVMRLAQGRPLQASGPVRNDPALLINPLHTLRSSSPPNHLIRERERDFKILHDSYLHLQLDIKEEKRKLRKTEAQEQKLKDNIAALEKLISELRFELKTKSKVLDGLKKTLDTKIAYYEEKLAEKGEECNSVKEKLEVSEAEVETKQKRTDSLIEEYENKIKKMQEEHQNQVNKLQEEKETELKDRDAKLQILKQRMADSIGKNSNERQQQLDELKKDLIKASHQAKDLHKQLKHSQLNPPKCSNCITLEAELDEKCLQVRLKDKSINDLQNIGKSMQLQLHQQHRIIVMREERSYEKHRALCIRAGLKTSIKKAESSTTSRSATRPEVYKCGRRVNSAELTSIRKDAILTKWEEREKR